MSSKFLIVSSVRPYRLAVLAALALAVIAALVPSQARAAQSLSGKTVTIGQGQTVNDDVYAIGQHITVNGRVNGNLITAAGALRVNGTVTGSVIAAAGSVRVHGHVGHDVTIASGKVTVDPGATVGRDVLAAAGSAVINGQVERNARLGAGSIRLGPGAVVGGNLAYWGNEKPKLNSGAVVHGSIKNEPAPAWMTDNQSLWSASVIGWFRTLIGVLALGLLFVWLAPKFGHRTLQTLEQRPWASLGSGLLFLVAAPIVAALVFVAGLFLGGWWLSLMGIAVYWIALVLSIVIAGLFVGHWLLERAGRGTLPLWLSLVLGVVLLMLVSVIPIVGWIIVAIAGLAALGGLTLTALHTSQSSRAVA